MVMVWVMAPAWDVLGGFLQAACHPAVGAQVNDI
jgi:hypothetical protein